MVGYVEAVRHRIARNGARPVRWLAALAIGGSVLASCSSAEADLSLTGVGVDQTGATTTTASPPPVSTTARTGSERADRREGQPSGAEGAADDAASRAGGGGGAAPGDDGSGGRSAVRPRPDWLGTRALPTTPDGFGVPQATPDELVDRQLATIDTLPVPTSAGFEATIEPLSGDPLTRSTWTEACPVGIDDLRYVTLTFWGFDDRPHRGELILHQQVVDDVLGVFEALFEARYPIEEMRIVTQADLDAPPTGDTNNTTSFVCRPVTGGSRFSEHAYGLAVDLNPFHNPYVKDGLVLPELATTYVDRTRPRRGMIAEGDPAVVAFDAIGWGWGGRWTSLEDYQHFSLNGR